MTTSEISEHKVLNHERQGLTPLALGVLGGLSVAVLKRSTENHPLTTGLLVASGVAALAGVLIAGVAEEELRVERLL